MTNCQSMSDLAPAAAPTGRRERRKAETRARLVDAARQLFVERGVHRTRPQDIAEAADVASGTFYAHFADKGEAFRAFSDQTAAALMARIQTANRDARDFEERLFLSLDALLTYSDENPGTLRVLFTDAAVIAADLPPGSSLQEQFAASLAQGLRHAPLGPPTCFDADVVAHGIVGFVSQALRYGSEHGVARERLLRDVTRFLSRALGASEPRPPEETP